MEAFSSSAASQNQNSITNETNLAELPLLTNPRPKEEDKPSSASPYERPLRTPILVPATPGGVVGAIASPTVNEEELLAGSDYSEEVGPVEEELLLGSSGAEY